MRSLFLFLCLGLFFISTLVSAQSIDTVGFKKRKFKNLVGTSSLGYIGGMSGLYYLWYKDYPSTKFHFFNDNNSWLMMDKLGHATTAYHLGFMGVEALRSCNAKDNKAIWYGGIVGLTFLSTIEVFDGFSSEWGASPGDALANTLGAGMVISQELLWKEQRVRLKWSYHNSPYAQYRPKVLGNTFSEKVLKDYNGQSYWISANIYSFIPHSKIPKWLNIAVGYRGDGMLGGTSNPIYNDKGGILPLFERQRVIYLSFDVDLNKVPTKSKVVRTFLKAISIIKIPSPSFSFTSKKELKFHPLYY